MTHTTARNTPAPSQATACESCPRAAVGQEPPRDWARARLEALEAELERSRAGSGRFVIPPSAPAVPYWYVREHSHVYGPMAEPDVLDAMERGEFSARCSVARVGQDRWLSPDAMPIFAAILGGDERDARPHLPEMPVPGLKPLSFPGWARLAALSAAGVSGVGLLTPLGAAAAHDQIAPNIAAVISVWRLVTFALVASSVALDRTKMLSSSMLAAGSFLAAGWITRILSEPTSGLFAIDVLAALVLGAAALGFAQALEDHSSRVHQEAIAFAAALEPEARKSSRRWLWVTLAIVLTGIIMVAIGVGIWLLLLR